MNYNKFICCLAITFSLISCGGSDEGDTGVRRGNIINTNIVPAPGNSGEEIRNENDLTTIGNFQSSSLPQSATNSFVGQTGAISTQGNKLVDENGDVIQLRGMSLFWSNFIGKYYNNGVVSWLKNDWSINIIRAAMGVEDDGGYLSNPNRERQKVFTVIEAAIEQGIYVIVDWHSHGAENHQAEAIAFFSEVAQRYGDYPNVMYELYNEPIDSSWDTDLKPYHEAVIREIRRHDPDNLIICGTPFFSQRVDDVVGNAIDDVNVAYTLHYYASTHGQGLRDIAQTAIDANLPLFVTEHGTTEASGDGRIDVNETNVWWDFLDDNHISWCNWSIADKREASAALTPSANSRGGWRTDQITTSGNLVRDELKAKNGTIE